MTTATSPAASRYFLYRVVQLGWIVLVSLVNRALPTLSHAFGMKVFDVAQAVIGLGWVALTGVEIVLLWGLAREVAAHPAARLLRVVVGLAWASLAISLLSVVSALGGPDLLDFPGAVGRVVSWSFETAIVLGADVVLWIALERLLGDRLIPALRPAFYALRLLSVGFSAFNVLFHDMYRSLMKVALVGLVFPWMRLLVTVAWTVVVLTALHTLAQSAPAPAADAGGPAPPPREADGKTDLIVGALWLGGGLLVTFLSYSAASSGGGGRYVVTTGAIAVGVVRIVRGLTRLGRS